jgi:hypothetical protein
MEKRWLYLDDYRRVPDENWTLAKTYADCLLFLKAGNVEYLSLDHDIGACADCIRQGKHIGDMLTPETTFVNCCPHEKTGYDVVKWLCEELFVHGNDYWPMKRPMCHSANPVGRNRIEGTVASYWPRVQAIRERRSLQNDPPQEPSR